MAKPKDEVAERRAEKKLREELAAEAERAMAEKEEKPDTSNKGLAKVLKFKPRKR